MRHGFIGSATRYYIPKKNTSIGPRCKITGGRFRIVKVFHILVNKVKPSRRIVRFNVRRKAKSKTRSKLRIWIRVLPKNNNTDLIITTLSEGYFKHILL